MSPVQRLIAKMKLQGAGDVVALVAQPIAKAIDAVARTKISSCPSCSSRRTSLNRAFPIGKESLDSPGP